MKYSFLIKSIMALALMTSMAYSQQGEVSVALEGLDPVLLVQGKETLGKTSITVTRGRFQYFFSSEDNRAAFVKDPERFEIQLGGSCARMGPQVGGNPDRFSVHHGRIYIFGSDDCKQNFDAAPAKYLAPAIPEKLNASEEALGQGRTLIEKVVEKSGGAARLDAIRGYSLTAVSVVQTSQGDFKAQNTLLRSLPGDFRYERLRPFGKTVDVITSADAFQIFIRNEQQSVRDLPAAHRDDLTAQFRRSILDVLTSRNQPGFIAALTGEDKAGETPVKLVEVLHRGAHFKLGIDPVEGRILTMTFSGRHDSTGEIGEVVQTFSDFRAVDGVTLPFKIDSRIDGGPHPSGSMTVESIALDPKLDPAIFRKP